MKHFLAGFAVLFFAFSARANDSAIEGIGGSPTALGSLRKIAPLKGEHPSIQMVNERVNITVNATTYDVRADFEFFNSGGARTVLMGFPEGAAGDMDSVALAKKTAYRNFKTSVDGQAITARRIPLSAESSEFEFDAYWVKSVPFARRQTRHVRVSYRAPLGETVDSRFLTYDFTGGNWKGVVKDSLLTVNFAAPGRYTIWPIAKELKAQQWREGDTLYFRWHNWQAQSGFTLRFDNALPAQLTRAYHRAELKQKAPMDEGQSMMLVKAATNSDAWRAPLARPTDYVLRDGHSFVAMSELADLVRREVARRQYATNKPLRYGTLKWNPQSRSATLTLGSGRQLQFTAGSHRLMVDGRALQMSAASFIGSRGGGETLYVPLATAIDVLGGQVEANAQTRRVWIDLEKMN